MRHNRRRISLFGLVLLVATGCATHEEWRTWKDHGTHFASGDHLSFSVRHPEGGVTRRDIDLARQESWWGKPVVVGQEAILER
jgi:hypothetical protein